MTLVGMNIKVISHQTVFFSFLLLDKGIASHVIIDCSFMSALPPPPSPLTYSRRQLFGSKRLLGQHLLKDLLSLPNNSNISWIRTARANFMCLSTKINLKMRQKVVENLLDLKTALTTFNIVLAFK